MDLQRRLDDLKARHIAAAAPPPVPRARPLERPRTLADVLCGAEHSAGEMRCWRIATGLAAPPALNTRVYGGTGGLAWSPTGQTPTLVPESTLLLDIETGGFAGAPVFLIGLVRLGERPLQVVQFLARDYPEEAAILHALARAADGCDTWVTFNGKSFDEPFLRDRAAVHRLTMPAPRLHFDLLHAARRAWRDRVPDCRLATLERHVLGRTRRGDVPSRDVPDLFHLFFRTGNPAPLQPVLEHNRLDLVAATELLIRLMRLGIGD
ncbi:MAG: ribonuclease H-like domain-containing protein [Planctomycetota bacterium]